MIRPYQSIQIPRHIAQATRALMAPLILALEWQGDFWTTWALIYGAQHG